MKNKIIIITVDVEEWFHTKFFDVEKIIDKYYEGEYPKTDVVENVEELLHLFERYNVRATFFILGETANRYPKLINLIEKRNHEIACHGYYHNKKYKDLNDFRDDLEKFKKSVKKDVVGFRYPNYDINDQKLDIVREMGFTYDSSIVPCRNIPGWYGNPDAPLIPYNHKLQNGKTIKEFPISVSPTFRLPGSGGWYLRNVGYWWTMYIIKSSLKKNDYVNLYFHPWEFSKNNPKYNDIPFHVYRRTGPYARTALERLLVEIKGSDCIMMQDYLTNNEVG
jgi:polysaccharide deacetylase family protein (PEP-CTERM system associated)